MPDDLPAWLAAAGYRPDWAAAVADVTLAVNGPKCEVILRVRWDGRKWAEAPVEQVPLELIRRLNELKVSYEIGWQDESRIEAEAGTAGESQPAE